MKTIPLHLECAKQIERESVFVCVSMSNDELKPNCLKCNIAIIVIGRMRLHYTDNTVIFDLLIVMCLLLSFSKRNR